MFILIMESNPVKKVKYKEYLSNENVEIPERTSRRHRAKKLKLMNEAVIEKNTILEEDESELSVSEIENTNIHKNNEIDYSSTIDNQCTGHDEILNNIPIEPTVYLFELIKLNIRKYKYKI